MIKIANNLVVFANTKSAGGLGTAKVAPRATRGTASVVASRSGVASGAPRGMVPAVPLARPINAPVAPIGTASTTPVATPINAPVAPAVRASSPSLVEQAFTALGGKALQKGWNAAQSALKTGPRSFGDSVPEGPGMAERALAQTQANALLARIQAAGGLGDATITGARIKTPASIAGHGSTASAATMNDLAGMRVSMARGDYSTNAMQQLKDRLSQFGITFSGDPKTIVRDGFHGVNMKGNMSGPGGAMGMPIEIQATPRRLIPASQIEHSTVYKPQESGVNPQVAQLYKHGIRYYNNTVSPFVPASTRVAHAAGAAGTTAAAGYGAYAATAGGTPQIPAEGGYVAAPPDTSPTPQSTVGTQASIAPLAPGPSS